MSEATMWVRNMYSGPGGGAYTGPDGGMYTGPGGGAYTGPDGGMYTGPGGGAYTGPGGGLYTGPGCGAYRGPRGGCYKGPGGGFIQAPMEGYILVLAEACTQAQIQIHLWQLFLRGLTLQKNYNKWACMKKPTLLSRPCKALATGPNKHVKSRSALLSGILGSVKILLINFLEF